MVRGKTLGISRAPEEKGDLGHREVLVVFDPCEMGPSVATIRRENIPTQYPGFRCHIPTSGINIPSPPSSRQPHKVNRGSGRTQAAPRATPEMLRLRGEFRRSESREGGQNSIKKPNPCSPSGRDFIGSRAGSPGSELGRSSAFPFHGCIPHSFRPFLKFLLPAKPCHCCLLRPESPRDPSHPAPCGGLASGSAGTAATGVFF